MDQVWDFGCKQSDCKCSNKDKKEERDLALDEMLEMRRMEEGGMVKSPGPIAMTTKELDHIISEVTSLISKKRSHDSRRAGKTEGQTPID